MAGRSVIAVSLATGFLAGGFAVQGLHAQPPHHAYVISEIEVTDAAAYARDYVPLANAALAASGQERLVSGGRTVALAGAPPAGRIVVSRFANLAAAQAAYTSPAYLEARRIGDRHGRLRIFAVEAMD